MTATKKYVLRANMFAYDDEYYDFYDKDGGSFCGAYSDLETAMTAWKQAELAILPDRPLSMVRDFFERSPEELREFDEFVFSRCGEHIIYGEESWAYPEEDCEKIIQKMSPDDIFEFVQKAEVNSYQLCEFDADTKFYVRWLPEQNAYQFAERDYDEGYFLCCESSYEALLDSYFDDMHYEGCQEGYHYEEQPYKLKGTLEELSHSPALLKSLIADDVNLKYDEQAQELQINMYNSFTKVYPLLSKPPFEVQEVTTEQINEIIRQYKNSNM